MVNEETPPIDMGAELLHSGSFSLNELSAHKHFSDLNECGIIMEPTANEHLSLLTQNTLGSQALNSQEGPPKRRLV